MGEHEPVRNRADDAERLEEAELSDEDLESVVGGLSRVLFVEVQAAAAVPLGVA